VSTHASSVRQGGTIEARARHPPAAFRTRSRHHHRLYGDTGHGWAHRCPPLHSSGAKASCLPSASKIHAAIERWTPPHAQCHGKKHQEARALIIHSHTPDGRPLRLSAPMPTACRRWKNTKIEERQATTGKNRCLYERTPQHQGGWPDEGSSMAGNTDIAIEQRRKNPRPSRLTLLAQPACRREAGPPPSQLEPPPLP